MPQSNRGNDPNRCTLLQQSLYLPGRFKICHFIPPTLDLKDPKNPPIFDLIISDFIASGKKAKMIFVSAEQSKALETIESFKSLYDGGPKAYPNGYMMLFIPLFEGQQPSNEFQMKVLFNHDQYTGEEAAFSIGGLEDLKTQVKFQNGKTVSIRKEYSHI